MPQDSTTQQKLEPFLQEPLGQLQARSRYLLAHPEAQSGDESWHGLRELKPLSQEWALFNPETASAEAQQFKQGRIDAVNNVLEHSPYVFIAGLSGVGKSTFVTKEFCTEKDTLYHGENELLKWLTDPSDQRKILFHDEATLSARDWSEIEGLFHIPPGILYKGTYYPLTPEHKVIFAGNPVNYSSDRRLASLFQHHGNKLIFEPLPTAALYEEILKPVFSGTSLEQQSAELSTHFLKTYTFLVACSKTDVLISPRESDRTRKAGGLTVVSSHKGCRRLVQTNFKNYLSHQHRSFYRAAPDFEYIP